MRFGEGSRRGTHLHPLPSLSPHTPQQVGLTKDFSQHHKHEPKAHTHPATPPPTCAPARPRARTRTHVHVHTRELQVQHFVRDCTGRRPAGLASQPAKHKYIFKNHET